MCVSDPLLVGGDGWGGVVAVNQMCQCLRVSVCDGPVNHRRGRGTVERWDGGYTKHYQVFSSLCLFRETKTYSPSDGFDASRGILNHHGFRLR